MRDVHTPWTILFLLLCVFLFPDYIHAQTPCGNIIEPENWFDMSSSQVTTPVGDCADPFEETHDQVSPYTLTIDGQVAHDGDTISVPEGGAHTYEVTGDPLLSGANYLFFLHDGNDYRFFNTAISEPVEADYRRLAGEFFVPGTDIEPYIATILSGDFYLSDSDMQQQLFGFLDYVDQHFVPVVPALRAGTYTLVIKEFEFIVTKESFFEKIFAYILPYAHAQTLPQSREYIFTTTFTITEEPAAPQGVSSILFLPGIQSSRLYMQGLEGEEQLWEPFGNTDVENLAMTDEGMSENTVYTRDVIDEIYGAGGDIYKTFIEFLDGFRDGVNTQVQIFPYDWRYDVFDIVEEGTSYETGQKKKLVETVDYLAALSPTDKVTIIAHSNGGLLAKALMIKLEEVGKADLVDKVIFIATPHLGTPKAIAAILHGFDQEFALNIPADVRAIRAVTKNMPGVYGLLPSETYIDSITEPLISFDGSSSTALYRNEYGFTLTSMDEYTQFLNGDEGRTDDENNISLPTTANTGMLASAIQKHEALDNWVAPDGVEVFNIVGTGLETPKSVEYQEFSEQFCETPACVIKKIEPVVRFTQYGDETVVSTSAKGVVSGTQLFIDMLSENKGESKNSKHSSITESNAVQSTIRYILNGSSTADIAYVSINEPTITGETTRVVRIHSPARIYIQDISGKRTGRDSESKEWKEEIPGTHYFEIGGVKYILAPSNLEYKAIIEGEGSGLVTQAIDELNGEEQTTLHTLTVPVTPTTRVTYDVTPAGFGEVTIDSNGDGFLDKKLTIDGVVIDTRASYEELRTTLRTSSLPKVHERIVLGIVDQAEKFYQKRIGKNAQIYEKLEEGTLFVLDQTLIQLRKGKLISVDAYQRVKIVIDKLIKQ